MKLDSVYYANEDVVFLAKDLIGKCLFTQINGKKTGGFILETEAYNGVLDKACHAYGGRQTPRTELMYQKGGISYIYLCYGIHHLFNVVTGLKDNPQAVLIRAIQPSQGMNEMLKRRKAITSNPQLFKGPAKVTQALGISLCQNGINLNGNVIWIEDPQIKFNTSKINIGSRIGVDYAGADAKLPYRFWVDNVEF